MTGKLLHRSLSATTALALVLSTAACQTTNVTSYLPGGYLADKEDACISQRQRLDSSGQTFETELFRNVILGGLVGVAGAAIAGENLFLGAGIGIAASIAGTYLYNLQRKHDDPGQLTQAAIADVRADNQRIDQLLSAFDQLVDCRKREAADVRAAYRAGSIDRTAAQSRLVGIRDRYHEDVRHARDIAENIADRASSYAAVYNQIAADNGGEQMVLDDYQPTAKPQPAAPGYQVLRDANIRSGPGTNFERVATLAAGTRVTVLGEEDGWHRIQRPDGGTAYIATFLVGPAGSAVPPRTTSAKVVAKPAEKPIKDERLESVKLDEGEKGLVDDLQQTTLTNVEKRDQAFAKVSSAEAEEDEIFGLS